jgi:hypothetical protein
MESTTIGDECEKCEFFYDLQRAKFRIQDPSIKSEFEKILEEKKGRCNRCNDRLKAFISDHPVCLGFDGGLKMEEKITPEDAETDFNKLIS